MRSHLVASAAAAAAALVLSPAEAAVPLSSSQTLFGHAIKNGPLPPAQELVTFQHNCTYAPCTVTQLHFPSIYPGSNCLWDWENGRFRAYTDGVLALDVSLLELAHVGKNGTIGTYPVLDGSPFGNSLFGKTAKSGGVYSTMRIPFSSNLTTTIQAPPTCNTTSIFWYIVRGVEGMPIQLGDDIILPDQAAISMYRNENVTLQPEDFITVASADSSTAGALISALFDVSSQDPNYLEACVRFYANGATSPQYLSSGTEDFFLSASYFDEGMFKTSQSGVTFAGSTGSFAMYKVFAERDYILWQSGMNMTWRNYENSCPTRWPWTEGDEHAAVKRADGKRLQVGPATYNTLVFMYTWPNEWSKLTYGGVPAPEYFAAKTQRAAAAAAPTLTSRLAVVRGLRSEGLIPAPLEERAVDALLEGQETVVALVDAYAADGEALARHLKRVVGGK